MKLKKLFYTLLCVMIACMILVSSTGCSFSIVKKPDLQKETEKSDLENKQTDESDNRSEIFTGTFDKNKNEDFMPDPDKFRRSQAEFAANLFKQSCLENENNTLVAPLSVMLALTMTANGAEGETLKEMTEVLGGELSIEELNKALSGSIQSLESDKNVKVSVANGIWANNSNKLGIVFKDEFLTNNEKYFNASVRLAPFTDETVDEINKFVKINTNEMIDNIIDEIDENAIMELVNALYFEAEWKYQYSTYAIHDDVFTNRFGDKKNVKMMASSEYGYIDCGGVTCFIMPYIGSYCFLAVLPPENVDIMTYIASIEGKTITGLYDNALSNSNTEVIAQIPEFSADYYINLSKPLIEMGMKTAFDSDNADFSGIADSENVIYINRVIHKTKIDLTPAGTKAGAATVVEFLAGSAFQPKDPPKKVTLDRPFVYAIVDTTSGLPIFLGALTDIS